MPNADTWTSTPGLLDLIEQGAGLDDLRQAELIKPAAIRSDSSPELFDRLVNWLRGYRRDRLLFERHPVWMPLAELWPPPGGTVTFKYSSSSSQEGGAELAVFGSKLGGSSRTILGNSMETSAAEQPLRICVRVFLTAWRYVSRADGEAFDRIDVDCEGAMGETDTFPAPVDGIGAGLAELGLDALLSRGFELADEGGPHRYSRVTGEKMPKRSYRSAFEREWAYEIGLPGFDLIQSNLKLRAKSTHSRAFEAIFELPLGHDYVFVQRKDERPVVPFCHQLPKSA